MADKETELKDIHQESIDAFALAEEAERDQREKGVEDMLFVDSEDGQWDDHARKVRKGKPMYTIDLVSEALSQIIGDQRQSKTRSKVDPDGNGADVDTAKIYDGLIRSIEKQSHAENAYDNAFKEKLKGGYGGWRYLTKYNDDDIFRQDIVIKPINSAVTSLYFDVDAEEYDKRDSTKAWLITEMSEVGFKAKYPDATITNFSDPSLKQGNCSLWFGDKKVRIAEYWKKEPIIKNIALMSDGKVIDIDESEKVLDELKADGITIVKERKVKSHKIVMYKMNGAEILSGPHEWAGKYIPLVPDYGEISHVAGKTFIRGKVRKAKDAARIYNYTTSEKVGVTALAAKDPYWATRKQSTGETEIWAKMNTSNDPVLFYTPDPDSPGIPQRGGAPQMQSALIEQTQQAANDVHSTLGMHNPALGNGPQLLSEKSMISQAEMGDRGSFEYRDNHEKSKEYGAMILVDLIPKIYDTPQMVQILNLDGSTESHEINKEVLDDMGQSIKDEETGDIVKINDLKKGKYAASVTTGPALKTIREETVKQLTELARVSPVFEQFSTDIIAKNMNITESEELTKRIRKSMITQQLIEPTEDEIKELGLDQVAPPSAGDQALMDNVNMQTEDLKAGIEKKDADTQKILVDTQTESIKAFSLLVDSFKKLTEMGVELTPQQRTLLVTQGDIVAGAQDITQEGEPNSEQAADLVQQIQAGTIRPEDLQSL
jgi:hypothetical protein